jgi:hypothetical protein
VQDKENSVFSGKRQGGRQNRSRPGDKRKASSHSGSNLSDLVSSRSGIDEPTDRGTGCASCQLPIAMAPGAFLFAKSPTRAADLPLSPSPGCSLHVVDFVGCDHPSERDVTRNFYKGRGRGDAGTDAFEAGGKGILKRVSSFGTLGILGSAYCWNGGSDLASQSCQCIAKFEESGARKSQIDLVVVFEPVGALAHQSRPSCLSNRTISPALAPPRRQRSRRSLPPSREQHKTSSSANAFRGHVSSDGTKFAGITKGVLNEILPF